MLLHIDPTSSRINFEEFRNHLSSLWRQLLAGVILGLLVVGAFAFRAKLGGLFSRTNPSAANGDVAVPTIVNGDLRLPQMASGSGNNISNLGIGGRVGVVSADLIPVFDQQTQKLTALRIIGEMQNQGDRVVTDVSPYLRFLDPNGNVVAQKIGQLTSGFSVFGLLPQETSLYDVTINDPPQSDKLEIVLNTASSSDSAAFDELKIADRTIDVKTATYQGPPAITTTTTSATSTASAASSSAQATPSASQTVAPDLSGQQIQYFTVSGSVVNTLSDPVSEITIYAWVKGGDGRVFAFAKQDYKNDLLSPEGKLDFRINVLPLRTDVTYDSYQVAVWGKRYKLGI